MYIQYDYWLIPNFSVLQYTFFLYQSTYFEPVLNNLKKENDK